MILGPMSSTSANRRDEYGVRNGWHEWSRSSGLDPWESVKSVSLPEGKASGNRKVFLPAIRVTTVMKACFAT